MRKNEKKIKMKKMRKKSKKKTISPMHYPIIVLMHGSHGLSALDFQLHIMKMMMTKMIKTQIVMSIFFLIGLRWRSSTGKSIRQSPRLLGFSRSHVFLKIAWLFQIPCSSQKSRDEILSLKVIQLFWKIAKMSI